MSQTIPGILSSGAGKALSNSFRNLNDDSGLDQFAFHIPREAVPAPVETVFIAVPPRRATLHV